MASVFAPCVTVTDGTWGSPAGRIRVPWVLRTTVAAPLSHAIEKQYQSSSE